MRTMDLHEKGRLVAFLLFWHVTIQLLTHSPLLCALVMCILWCFVYNGMITLLDLVNFHSLKVSKNLIHHGQQHWYMAFPFPHEINSSTDAFTYSNLDT